MNKLSELNETLAGNTFLRKFELEYDTYEFTLNLKLTVSDTEALDAIVSIIEFKNVSCLNLNEIGGGLTQFSFLRVEKLTGGLDSLRYRLSEIENNTIEFYFLEYEILKS